MIDSLPVLRVEEWPLPGESLTSDTVRLLIDRVCVFLFFFQQKMFILAMYFYSY